MHKPVQARNSLRAIGFIWMYSSRLTSIERDNKSLSGGDFMFLVPKLNGGIIGFRHRLKKPRDAGEHKK